MSHFRQKAKEVLVADTDNFVDLVRLSGLDPKKHFQFANLSGVDFSGCELDGYNFSHAWLLGCDFTGAVLTGARFEGAKVNDKTRFPNHSNPFIAISLLQGLRIENGCIAVLARNDGVMILPKGATPVDFAFEIHSEVGANCVGAKINGRLVPLSTELATGDCVEIITSNAAKPQPSWASFAATRRARRLINKLNNKESVVQHAELGAFILERAIQRYFDEKVAPPGNRYSIPAKSKNAPPIRGAVPNDLLIKAGRGTIRIERIEDCFRNIGALSNLNDDESLLYMYVAKHLL